MPSRQTACQILSISALLSGVAHMSDNDDGDGDDDDNGDDDISIWSSIHVR